MKQFRNIAFVIIACISALFILNIFFLKELFDSIEADTRQIVYSCIEEADTKEMEHRMYILSQSIDGQRFLSIERSFSNDTVSVEGSIETVTRSHVQGDTLKSHSEKADENNLPLLQMMNEVRLAVHHNIDPLIPIDLNKLNDLINDELQNRSILSKVLYSEIINLETDSILFTSRNNSHSVTASKENPFVYKYDLDNKYAYRVYAESLTSVVLKQMLAILISTLLIIILLGVAFWYFIRTVMQQKTLEEMKDDFTNNMTHELKTPIAVAYSAADTLLHFKQGNNKEKREKYLRECINQLTKLEGLVEQILSMSMEKRKSILLNKEDVEIKPLVSLLIEQFRLKSDNLIAFRIAITPDDLTIFADPTHFSNMIGNLIDNAVKYSSAKAMVEIEAFQEREYSIIKVKDHGAGISTNNQQRIFDKFYRVPGGNVHNVKGYGLGLYYVKQLVEKHDGIVSVESTYGKGSVFTLKIPTR